MPGPARCNGQLARSLLGESGTLAVPEPVSDAFPLPLFLPPLFLNATPAAAQMIEPARLQAAAEMFAGRPVVVDPRLLLPACRTPALAWGPGGRSVAISCAAPAWQVFVPLADGPAAAAAQATAPAAAPPATARPAIRRGDRVTVEAEGPGFVIAMDAVAENDSRDGRVQLRSNGGARRLTGIIGEDGRVRLSGLRPMVNGR